MIIYLCKTFTSRRTLSTLLVLEIWYDHLAASIVFKNCSNLIRVLQFMYRLWINYTNETQFLGHNNQFLFLFTTEFVFEFEALVFLCPCRFPFLKILFCRWIILSFGRKILKNQGRFCDFDIFKSVLWRFRYFESFIKDKEILNLLLYISKSFLKKF